MDERRVGRARRLDPNAGLVLAAVDRAARHRLPKPGPAPVWALLEHLAVPRRSGAARRVRVRLSELERAGLLEPGREHGLPVWSLTPAGRRVLDTAPAPALPESPRRRARRRARALAAQELPRFQARLAATLAETDRMLARAESGGAGAPAAAEWLRTGRVLAGDCRRLASAWHCLHEWEEPGDDEDVAAKEASQRTELAALRNVRLWREPD